MVKISTKGRYAIRVMLDLAENNTGHYMPLMDMHSVRKYQRNIWNRSFLY